MIHRYQKKGLNFVLDVNSGAVHLLDDISYAVSGYYGLYKDQTIVYSKYKAKYINRHNRF